MHKTTIKINGEKFRRLIEEKSGKTVYQVATDCGFSKNVLSNAIREGFASSAVQNIARLYGIAPVDYQIIEFKHEDPVILAGGQISIDDINKIEGLEEIIKNAVKAAIAEALLCSKTTVTTSGDAEFLAKFEI